jgi:phosphatidylglycerol---prolipoprotein diacylglyceryl transferase
MIPQFGSVFGEPIPAYFAMLMTGFIVAVGLGALWAQRSGLDRETVIDLGLAALIAGVAGARIMHVFVDGHFMEYVHMCTDPSLVAWEELSRAECASDIYRGRWDVAANVCRPTEGDCFAWAKFWQGGLVWYGGLLGAGPYCIYFLRKEGFPVRKGIDMAGMFIPLGVFFGRLGCWFGGCCFGHVSDHWSAVRFPANSPASEAHFLEGLLPSKHMESLPVLPTQLYEAIGCLAVSALCVFVVHPRKRFDGQVFCVSMIGYSAVRFALEYLRADERGAFLFFSTSQWISVAIVIASIALWMYFAKSAKERMNMPFEEVPAAV